MPHSPRPAPRRRRAPALARQEILDAADRVFADSAPDRVGLKEIAAAAGVSHALVTHYFRTYAGLIEATFERRIRALRESVIDRMGDAGVLARPNELLGLLFRTLQDPVHVRLTRWLLASESPAAAQTLGMQDHGIQLVARQVATALEPKPSAALVERLGLTLLTAVAAAYGYALAKHTLVGSLGRDVSPELDADVERTLSAMLAGQIRAALKSSQQ
ncbi:MAG TPA: helix-turn-helix domain-containing protein [Kofleriaceae bacterium]|jgi:AcrR family transcriptional regulator